MLTSDFSISNQSFAFERESLIFWFFHLNFSQRKTYEPILSVFDHLIGSNVSASNLLFFQNFAQVLLLFCFGASILHFQLSHFVSFWISGLKKKFYLSIFVLIKINCDLQKYQIFLNISRMINQA